MSKLDELFTLYKKLCSYCDDLFAGAISRFPDNIECKDGCSQCCTIQTVTKLEASAIQEYLKTHNIERNPGDDECVFLQNGSCGIYPVRPIICRTHGLILFNSEDKTFARSCNMNFRHSEGNDCLKVCAVNTSNITENLVRLNMAYLKIIGDNEAGLNRVSLGDLLRNTSNKC